MTFTARLRRAISGKRARGSPSPAHAAYRAAALSLPRAALKFLIPEGHCVGLCPECQKRLREYQRAIDEIYALVDTQLATRWEKISWQVEDCGAHHRGEEEQPSLGAEQAASAGEFSAR